MHAYQPTRLTRHYWRLLLLWGILVGIFGLCALFWPHLTLLTLIVLFGTFALVNGVLGVALALQQRRVFPCWWATLAAALISVLVGLAVLAWPRGTALVVLYLIAAWALITGVLQLTEALGGMSRHAPLYQGIAGAASIVLGLLLFVVSPVVALLSLVWIIGLYALVSAAMLIMRAFFSRRWAYGDESRVRGPEFLP